MSGQLLGLLIGPFEAFGFMRVALVASFALALANGPVGTLLLMRRESLSGYVLSHAVMPGAALGFLYAGYSLAALSFGGLLTGLVVAGLAALKARSMPQRQDVILIAFYLVSLSFGILIVAARGSQADLMHVLFGTVLAVDVKALLLIAGITSITLLVIAALYRPLAVESFDPSFLRAVGGGGGLLPLCRRKIAMTAKIATPLSNAPITIRKTKTRGRIVACNSGWFIRWFS